VRNKYFFISDLHLGLYPEEKSRQREKVIVNWLDNIKNEAAELFLVGDIFDFWYEYKKVVPRGFTRFLGKLAELSDEGVKITFIPGNHDKWVIDYFEKEIGIKIQSNQIVREINGLKLLISHGDGIGPGEHDYKILKYLFDSKLLRYLFSKLHPNVAICFGQKWSKHSRYAKGLDAEPIKDFKKEPQIIHALEILKKEHYDFIIFGHRHIPYIIKLNENSTIINLGDWITNFTYAILENKNFYLKSIYNNINIIEKHL